MNRRQFTTRLGALFATPLMPTPSMASLQAMATSNRPLSEFKPPFAWARFTARCKGYASPELFETQLGLSPEKAKDVYAVLIKENVLSMPNSAGIARALDPLTKSHEQIVQWNIKEKLKRAADKLRENLTDETDAEQNPEIDEQA